MQGTGDESQRILAGTLLQQDAAHEPTRTQVPGADWQGHPAFGG